MSDNRISFSSRPVASEKYTSDVSDSARKDGFPLTVPESLSMLEAYKNQGRSHSLLPEIQEVDTENTNKSLLRLIDMGLLQDTEQSRAENENREPVLTARGEEVIRQIRTTWKVLMGQPSVSIVDIRTAIHILAQMDPQGSCKTAHRRQQY